MSTSDKNRKGSKRGAFCGIWARILKPLQRMELTHQLQHFETNEWRLFSFILFFLFVFFSFFIFFSARLCSLPALWICRLEPFFYKAHVWKLKICAWRISGSFNFFFFSKCKCRLKILCAERAKTSFRPDCLVDKYISGKPWKSVLLSHLCSYHLYNSFLKRERRRHRRQQEVSKQNVNERKLPHDKVHGEVKLSSRHLTITKPNALLCGKSAWECWLQRIVLIFFGC